MYVVVLDGILKLRSRQIITNYIHNVHNCYQSCNKGDKCLLNMLVLLVMYF